MIHILSTLYFGSCLVVLAWGLASWHICLKFFWRFHFVSSASLDSWFRTVQCALFSSDLIADSRRRRAGSSDAVQNTSHPIFLLCIRTGRRIKKLYILMKICWHYRHWLECYLCSNQANRKAVEEITPDSRHISQLHCYTTPEHLTAYASMLWERNALYVHTPAACFLPPCPFGRVLAMPSLLKALCSPVCDAKSKTNASTGGMERETTANELKRKRDSQYTFVDAPPRKGEIDPSTTR